MPKTSDEVLKIPEGESKEARIARLAITVRLNREYERALGKPVFNPEAEKKAMKAFQKIESE